MEPAELTAPQRVCSCDGVTLPGPKRPSPLRKVREERKDIAKERKDIAKERKGMAKEKRDIAKEKKAPKGCRKEEKT